MGKKLSEIQTRDGPVPEFQTSARPVPDFGPVATAGAAKRPAVDFKCFDHILFSGPKAPVNANLKL